MNMLEKFKEVAEKNNEKIKKLQEESAALIKPLLQSFISDYPQVKQIKWAQYTPYFNDGEPCVFGICTVGFYFDGDDLDGTRYDADMPYKYEADWWTKRDVCSVETYNACRELEANLNQAKDALQTLFGDHVEVTVNAHGVDVEEYDHD